MILGISVGEKLNWHARVQYNCRKCLPLLFLIMKVKYSFRLSTEVIISLIKALLHPVIFYAHPAWCNLGKNDLVLLYCVLKRVHRLAGIRLEFDDCAKELDRHVLPLYNSACDIKLRLNSLIPSQPGRAQSNRVETCTSA